MGEVAEVPRSQFLTRFSSLPVVHTALGYATNTYGRVKEVNPVIAFTLTTAEKSVLYANEKAQPIVKRFERQISLADGLACKGLEKLEEKVPLITKPTEVILQDTKTLYNYTIKTGCDGYNNVKSFGTMKVNAVKDYGVQTAVGLIQSPYGKLLTESVNGALTLTENCVEHVLPPFDDSDKDDVKKTEVFLRVANLTNRIQNRLYHHALHKAQNLKQTATESVQRYSSSQVLTNAYTNATWVWEELNKEPESTTENLSLNHQLLSTARFTTRQLVSAFVTARTTITVIPTRVNDGLSTVYNFTTVLPSHLNNGLSSFYHYSTNATTYIHNINPTEVATALLQLKDRLKLEDNVTFVFQTIVQNPAVQWLASTNHLRISLGTPITWRYFSINPSPQGTSEVIDASDNEIFTDSSCQSL